MIVRAAEHDTLDRLLWEHLGSTAQLAAALALNPGLADLGDTIPHGTAVSLPDPPARAAATPTVQLWD